ncbi:MAG: hypothetical protein GY941_01075 [Planctomycetes bacterium]|nr:hypothetical protein [Planctomycetota bacterium]
MKYPDITVSSLDDGGNAIETISRTITALRKHGVDEQAIEEYREQARTSAYDNVIQTTMQWVDVT